MKSQVVGILGYSGAIGRTAVSILKDEYLIIGGQRSLPPENMKDIENCTWMQVNVYDRRSLENFCKGCDVILNCAGPSYLIKDRAAQAAMKSGACYIDVFGADFLEDIILKNNYDNKGKFIISAGNFPGLSGIIPCWLSKQEFDSVEKMEIFTGGMEKSTKSACADVLLSSVYGFGNPGCIFRNNDIVKSLSQNSEKCFIPGFKEEVYGEDFINAETVRAAKKLKLKEARLVNVMTSNSAKEFMAKACSAIIMDKSEKTLNDTVAKVTDLINMSIGSSMPWYTMMIEMQGTINNKSCKKRLILKSDNSYELSGITAACAVKQVLEADIECGVHWAFECLDSNKVIKELLKAQCVTQFDVLDIPLSQAADNFDEMEEGTL